MQKNSEKNESRGYRFYAYIIVGALILIVGVVMAILAATVWDTNAVHPLLLMLGIFAACFGALSFVYGITAKNGFYVMVGAFLLFLGMLYFGIDIFEIRPWWISLIVGLLIGGLCMLGGLMFSARGIEVRGDNDRADYKNYKERRAEEEANKPKEEEQELPKIK